MTMRSKTEAKKMLEVLRARLGQPRLTDEDRQEIQTDIDELTMFINCGKLPDDKYSNVFQWLTFGHLSTLAI